MRWDCSTDYLDEQLHVVLEETAHEYVMSLSVNCRRAIEAYYRLQLSV